MAKQATSVLVLAITPLLLACSARSDAAGVVSAAAQAIVDGPIAFAAGVDISKGTASGLSALDARDLDGDGLVGCRSTALRL